MDRWLDIRVINCFSPQVGQLDPLGISIIATTQSSCWIVFLEKFKLYDLHSIESFIVFSRASVGNWIIIVLWSCCTGESKVKYLLFI